MDAILAFAFGPEGAGGAVAVPERVAAVDDAAGLVWVHVNATGPEGRGWIEAAGFDALTHAALTADETRPRATVHGQNVLMNLRGVNLNPGADPEDMVSLRMFLGPHLVVTVERRELVAIDDVIAGFARGPGPTGAGELVARIALRIADRAEPVVARLNERIDDLETRAPTGAVAGLRPELADIRRTAILLRRYLVPQRDALSTLEIEDLDWLSNRDRSRLREASERVTRLGEELDAIRDRAQVVHDMIADQRAEDLNRRMLLLAVVSAVFLPLAFVTGLLGINVAGIPGAHHPAAFWAVTGLLVLLGLGLLGLFRWLGFFGGGD